MMELNRHGRRDLKDIVPHIEASWTPHPSVPKAEILRDLRKHGDISEPGAYGDVAWFLVESEDWTGPIALGIRAELIGQKRDFWREVNEMRMR